MKASIIISSLFIICFSFLKLHAQADDDNVIVELKTESYTFKKSGDRVWMEEETAAEYRSTKWAEKIIAAEFYNLNTTIQNVSVAASRKVKPVYQMYQQSGIFYNDVKVCFIELPFTKKDEKITLSFEKTYNDILTVNQIFLFEPQFVKQKKVEITIPGWIEVDIIERNFTENVVKETAYNAKADVTTYIYTITSQPPAAMQPDAPSYRKTAPHLLLRPKKTVFKNKEKAYFNHYDDVYKWCKEKIDHVDNDTAAISEFTQKLIGPCAGDAAKIAALFAWVQNNIRYIAFEYGLAGWVPDNAQDVLQKKYGDCKGMSNLLKTMLQSAGFDARLVWILTRSSHINAEIPLPLFNHMICALFYNDEIIYLDPTVKYMGVGEYHDAVQGCGVLIESGDSYLLERIPEILPAQNTDSLHAVYTIDGSSLAGSASMTLCGENKQAVLSSMNMINSPLRMSAAKRFLENGKSEAKVSDVVVRVDSAANNLVLEYKEVCSGRVNKLNDELYVSLDSRHDFYFAAVDTLKRKEDILFPFKEKIVREEYLALPAGYDVVSLPEKFYIENENYSFSTQYSIDGGSIKYLKEIMIKNTWLKKENFGRWNADLLLLKNNYSNQVVLREIKNEEDIPSHTKYNF